MTVIRTQNVPCNTICPNVLNIQEFLIYNPWAYRLYFAHSASSLSLLLCLIPFSAVIGPEIVLISVPGGWIIFLISTSIYSSYLSRVSPDNHVLPLPNGANALPPIPIKDKQRPARQSAGQDAALVIRLFCYPFYPRRPVSYLCTLVFIFDDYLFFGLRLCYGSQHYLFYGFVHPAPCCLRGEYFFHFGLARFGEDYPAFAAAAFGACGKQREEDLLVELRDVRRVRCARRDYAVSVSAERFD